MDQQEFDAIQACKRGQRDRFAYLYDAYARKIYDFIYYRTHHRETAEDLSSLVFTRALEHIGSFNERKGAFSSWLYRIARNAVIDHYRSFRQADDIESAWDVAARIDIPRDVDTAARLERVQEYLRQLPRLQREIVIMRVWDSMSHREIADTLGISEASAKVAFSRALAKINRELAAALLLLLFLKPF
jgi:RNA polymerase sigma-70 factor (ECF subfamily)